MDILQILEQFGLPVTITAAFGYFIWKQNNWIQKELVEDLDERFKRLEGIIIKSLRSLPPKIEKQIIIAIDTIHNNFT